jgi:hypothetical protein
MIKVKTKIAGKKKHPFGHLKKEGESYGRFLKMIDDLQTPKHKTNHKYRRCFPLF